jgi:hypothetical protein
MKLDKLLQIAGIDRELIKESKFKNLLKENEDMNVSGARQAFENTSDDYLQKTLESRNPPGTGSEFSRVMTIEELKNASWKPYQHPSVKSPNIAYIANIPGKIGVIEIDNLPDQTPVRFQLSHNGTGGKSGKATEVVAKFDTSLTSTNATVAITGPSFPGYFKNSADHFIVYTFHPGEPLPLQPEIDIDEVSKALGGNMVSTVRKAKELGFTSVKQVQSLNESKRLNIHRKNKLLKESDDFDLFFDTEQDKQRFDHGLDVVLDLLNDAYRAIYFYYKRHNLEVGGGDDAPACEELEDIKLKFRNKYYNEAFKQLQLLRVDIMNKNFPVKIIHMITKAIDEFDHIIKNSSGHDPRVKHIRNNSKHLERPHNFKNRQG